ncbi:T9SS type A sorting domain-containing protein [Kordia sp. YSTF-M3]|uniref:T9SS type A sorting domain-containing protein n=1 Tax=Kordia aestuariivivens TaxID=2759037 RepID=A0ABR7Q8K7_9FLAO|nr:zinc-dependent metalloprotease family protein [Kordia aestuariivivens]MBC8754878.1 T9SS type A sorting domain-containing protein [Kordia aestuariivivens]
MRKNYFFILLLLPLFAFSQGKSFWKKTDNVSFQQSELLERASTPIAYDVYTLDINSLKQLLAAAPDRDLNIGSEIVVQFPNAEGKMEDFEVYNASVMEPTFAANYPEIQSYVAVSRENTGTIIRFSTTVLGFHATVQAIGKTLYIDPLTNDLQTYIMYEKENLYSNFEDRIGCLVDESTENRTNADAAFAPENANDGTLRTFRLALSCTQEYANYHINAAGQGAATDAVKRATVLAAMNVTMTRVNAVFERDMSLTMTLVDNTSIIFLAENDGFTDSDATLLINENQAIIDANIGTANYDIGHVFTTGGGGLAARGGICYSNAKARGVTGSPNPVGDPFDIDFVAHEMGHQYGANHTFNGGQGSCSGGNRSATTAVEPGSGTTIMAYAGICGSDNVQGNSDDHFHAISIAEMWERITPPGEPTCSTNTPNGNTAPVVNAGADYTIPYGTAFTLSGTATDANAGDVLSYCWEQTDVGVTTNVPSTTSTTDPQFRSYSPMTTGDRTFPQLSDILDNNLTPAWEVMPSVARTMDFALTVRDNGSPNGGQTNRANMTVTTANTGPFRVTAPDTTNESFSTGTSTNVTWDVAGTTANGINTSNVNILLSTDGGLTFPTTLAANTANDGTESITFPIVFEPYCRIKIEAVGNIFFAISKSFSIGATVVDATVCNTYTTGAIATAIPDGGGANVQGTPVFIPVTVTESTPITDLRVRADVTHSYIGDLIMQLQTPNGGGFSNIWARTCNTAQFGNIDVTFKDGEAAIMCANPTTGLYAPANPMTGFLGNNPSGTWNLVFVDFFNGDTGVVNEWSVELCTTSTTVTLSNEEFTLENFALYPNPNKGDFSLSFNSTSGENIDVNVYDISGRLVHTKNYNATSTFNENISLKNVSSGMYLISVTDQDKTVTKKLIIE